MPTSHAQELTLDIVYARIGLGRFHVLLVTLCGIGFAACAVEVVMLGFVVQQLRPEWELDEYQLGLLSAVKDFGVLIGELVWGSLADHYGRRSTFIASMAIVAFFGAGSALASGINSLIFVRSVVGFGYGGNLVIDLTLYSEFLPTSSRGKMLFFLAFFWPVGQILTTVLAWYAIPQYGWRFFIFICMLPALLTVFCRPLIPESPRWLCSQGRSQEATEVCRQIAIANGLQPEDVGLFPDVQVTGTGETTRLCGDAASAQAETDWVTLWFGPFQHLFSTRHARTSVGLMGVVMALNFAGYGANIFMPSLLEMKGVSQRNLYETMALSAVVGAPGVFVAMCIGSTFGRVPTLNVSVFFTMASLLLFAGARSTAVLTALSCVASFALEAAWAVFHVYLPEVYETHVRGTAGGFLEGFGTVIAMVAPMLVAYFVTNTTDSTLAVFVLASLTAFGAVAAYLHLHVETLDRDMEDGSPRIFSKAPVTPPIGKA